MEYIVLSALLVSALIYIYIGFTLRKKNKSIIDFIPISNDKSEARISTVDEFSTSTIATTVSLATIILAYFELSSHFGFILLWTVITTTLGMYLVSFYARRIIAKMKEYDYKPSLHEYLGSEYSSNTVSLVASISTSLGFLLIFATELIVGSRFLAGLVPAIPEWCTVIFLCTIGFYYTLSGFKTVIKTDQIQMKMIWAFIAVLGTYYLYHIVNTDWQSNLEKLPDNIKNIKMDSSLWSFIIGIAVMNIPTHLSSMGMFQRISAADNPGIAIEGLKKSTIGIAVSWGLLVVLACLAYMIVTPTNSQTLLTDLLKTISNNLFGKIVLFVSVLGLFASMLSTASTNLIVVTHTLSEDIFAKLRNKSLSQRARSQKEFYYSKLILFGSALLAIFLVEGLKHFGFSIADLVFAIYAGSLVLFPLILASLYFKKDRLRRMSIPATLAVIFGFIFAWGIAIFGKYIGNGNLIFLSPLYGIGISTLFILYGIFNSRMK